ncbi:MAG: hypothetical protein ETSY1_21755 [Candidatus Entotheonella factor]|uniref:Uncharacterized protein n=1 Tax=Entotheonella factor TaxID=1429438 RepID=W4LIW8_ENTF1|nr:hypothetical protein [Candidatus Entotheonella palauensis]ETW97665.1 MAG: hypothetical protein ETSY1_21755 [Candidatus Entotheonella factor]
MSSDGVIIRVRRNILKAAKDLMQDIEPTLSYTLEAARVLPNRMALRPEANVAEALRPCAKGRP